MCLSALDYHRLLIIHNCAQCGVQLTYVRAIVLRTQRTEMHYFECACVYIYSRDNWLSKLLSDSWSIRKSGFEKDDQTCYLVVTLSFKTYSKMASIQGFVKPLILTAFAQLLRSLTRIWPCGSWSFHSKIQLINGDIRIQYTCQAWKKVLKRQPEILIMQSLRKPHATKLFCQTTSHFPNPHRLILIRVCVRVCVFHLSTQNQRHFPFTLFYFVWFFGKHKDDHIWREIP